MSEVSDMTFGKDEVSAGQGPRAMAVGLNTVFIGVLSLGS